MRFAPVAPLIVLLSASRAAYVSLEVPVHGLPQCPSLLPEREPQRGLSVEDFAARRSH